MSRSVIILSFVIALATWGSPGAAQLAASATSSDRQGPLFPLELPEEENEEETSLETELFEYCLTVESLDLDLLIPPWHTLRHNRDEPFTTEPVRHGPNVSRAPPCNFCVA